MIRKSKTNKDALGSRMKKYEYVTRFSLPPRTYTVLRVDGRAFHTWTRGLARPYDTDFIDCMDAAAISLCEDISGSQFAFVQSDEISVLAVDFADIKSQPWFDGNIQKWASVGAAISGAAFNFRVSEFMAFKPSGKLGATKKPNAMFDARVFTIPDFVEVENYFVWRQKDAERNSVTMLAQAYASHKQLQNKNTSQRHEIIHAAGDNWAKHPVGFKHGRIIRKHDSEVSDYSVVVERPRVSNWAVDNSTPVFTKNRSYLREMIPLPWENDMVIRKATNDDDAPNSPLNHRQVSA
jgi:tRNA(His) guanylyltransferase